MSEETSFVEEELAESGVIRVKVEPKRSSIHRASSLRIMKLDPQTQSESAQEEQVLSDRVLSVVATRTSKFILSGNIFV